MGFRLAVRRLLSRPAYTGVLVVIVGVGIGAATTVYSVVDQLLLRPVPFAFAERLVDVLDTRGNNLTPEKIALHVDLPTDRLLMATFSAIAIVLTAAGLFDVLSQVVSRRTREIGIRVALGASPGAVRRQILMHGALLTATGIAGGIGAAAVLTRTLRALLFAVSPTDAVSFAAVSGLLATVAIAACWIPARSATRIEPAIALRVE